MEDKVIVWVHGDQLSPYSPALQAAPGAPAVFVWDDALLAEWSISLKRIVFMYECLLEMPVMIRRGNVAEEVIAFAEEHNARRILTGSSPSPHHRLLCQKISQGMPKGSRLEVLRPEPFVDYAGSIDLKRFSRYWQKVQRFAMKPRR